MQKKLVLQRDMNKGSDLMNRQKEQQGRKRHCGWYACVGLIYVLEQNGVEEGVPFSQPFYCIKDHWNAWKKQCERTEENWLQGYRIWGDGYSPKKISGYDDGLKQW